MVDGRSAERPGAATANGSSALGAPAVFRWIRRYAIFLVLGLLIVLFEVQEPAFLRVDNLFSVLQAVSVVALLGVGVTFSLAVSGFDLSVGSMAVLSLMLSSFAMVVFQFNAAETIIFALAIGAMVGTANGLLIVVLKIPDLLATLGMMFLLSGLTLIPSGGRSITTGLVLPNGTAAAGRFDPNFLFVGRHRVWGVVPLPVIIVALIALVAWFVMERTRWGRVFYAVGGNEAAAHLAGAPTKQYRVAAYVISGVLAALGGVFTAARMGRGEVFAGSSMLLDSVAAALIGYAVLDQRRANVGGTVMGAVFVGILLNGLTMLNAPYYTQDFVKGVVLVAALAVTFGIGRRR